MERTKHSHTTSSTKKYCCSYCREEGHNITKCGSPQIAELDKRGDEIGLFDVIVLMFCNSDALNYAIVYNERYNFTKMWLNKLTIQEIKVLTFKHKFHEINKNESIENQKKRLFYYYFDDRISNYSYTDYAALLFDMRNISKDKFGTYSKMYVDLIEEPELKRELKNELERISEYLYPSKKFNIKITSTKAKAKTPSTTKECPICYETMKTIITTNCNHEFCDSCIKSYFDSCEKHPSCPLCRESVMELKTTNKKIEQMLKKYCIDEVKLQIQEQSHQQPEENTMTTTTANPSLINIVHSIVGF